MSPAAIRRTHRQQEDFITYGLYHLGLGRGIERPYVGFQQVVNAVARYENYRHLGLAHRDALECLLYGDGWLRVPSAESGAPRLAGDL